MQRNMKPMNVDDSTPALVTTLPNGVRIATLPMPQRQTAQVGVFVRTGSAHESRADNGISHVLEHMAFKGTHTRDVQRVNLDAERLGAEVNAHTDKDHTAYHMHGLGPDAPALVAMLADIVRHATFPVDELEREREVILQEVAEVEDDPVTVAYHLFDHACWGLHPAALPVIGQRRHVERFSREDLMRYVARQYTGANIVLAAAGAIDAEAIVRAGEAAFGDMPAGTPNLVSTPTYEGGIRSKRMDGGSQAHLVMGFPIPALADDDMAGDVAAAIIGDGMSSPLLAELREKRGLVYHAACAADRFDYGGQLAIEASFAPEKLDEVLREVTRLLQRQAERVDAVDLERARNQIVVRLLRNAEQASRCIEDAALDLFTVGRLRPVAERVAQVRAVTAERVHAAMRQMQAAGAAVALTGKLPRQAAERSREALGGLVRR
jgi:predicted Zn-dependent peptidase